MNYVEAIERIVVREERATDPAAQKQLAQDFELAVDLLEEADFLATPAVIAAITRLAERADRGRLRESASAAVEGLFAVAWRLRLDAVGYTVNDDAPPWATAVRRESTYDALLHGGALETPVWQLVFGRPIARTRTDWSLASTSARVPIRGGTRVVIWPQPGTYAVRGLEFELQADGYLCALHALNNLARRTLVAPPQLVETMVAMRPDSVDADDTLSLFASRSELQIAALRRGVVLAPLVLGDVAGANVAIGSGPQACIASLVRRAGGLVLLFDSGLGGHFVSVLPLNDAGTAWATFNGRSLTGQAVDLAGALALAIGVRAASTAQAAEIVGLVPLDDTPHDATARLWRRNVVAGLTLVALGGGASDVGSLTPPPSPLGVNYACARIKALAEVPVEPNAFTFFAARYQVEDDLNVSCDRLAGLVREQRIDADAFATTLRVIGSTLRQPSALGCLVGPRDLFDDAAWLRYAAVGLVARRLVERAPPRLTLREERALTDAERTARARAAADYAATIARADVRQLVTLLCVVGWTFHEEAGAVRQVNEQRFRQMFALYERVKHALHELPPLLRFEPYHGSPLVNQWISPTGTPLGRSVQRILVPSTFGKAAWLLAEARDAGFVTAGELPFVQLSGALVMAFRLDALGRLPSLDDALDVDRDAAAFGSLTAARRSAARQAMRAALSADRGGPLAKLAAVFACSAAYADLGPLDETRIERDRAHSMHVLEELYVTAGVASLYGTVVDRPPTADRGLCAPALAQNELLEPLVAQPATPADFAVRRGEPTSGSRFDRKRGRP